MSKDTATILSYFEQLNAIPRCSHNEERVCKWLRAWAEQQQLSHTRDSAGNLVVRVPASPGSESAPVVVLQGHMDMVCEKTPDSSHDFNIDPIVSHRQGDWLTADGTTLGADNGIAIGYMLALAEDPSLDHPPLELLFTVDEETGLNGAKALQPDFIQGRRLINLDSEDEGIFTIGCAGGVDTTLKLAFETKSIAATEWQPHQVVVGGLKGGHSGIDIHKQRGNANKILARILNQLAQDASMGLISMQGGSRKNAIPRDARAIIGVDPDAVEPALQAVARLEQEIKAELAQSDASLFINMHPAPSGKPLGTALGPKDARKAIQLLMALPDGVAGMSSAVDGLVETSNNLATVQLEAGKLTVLSSQRSAAMSRMTEITDQVHAVARLAGADIEDHDMYPAWQPDMASLLLSQSKTLYKNMFGSAPVIQVIHAGLECAVIGDIYPGMDMISFGPTIRNPHSPDERLFVPSVDKVWDFLVALLKAFTESS